jgi:hypothetical protein
MRRCLALILPLAASGCADPGGEPATPRGAAPAEIAQARTEAPAPAPALTPQGLAGAALPPGGDPFRDPNPLVPRVRTPAPLPPGGDGGRTAEAIGALEGRVDLLSRRGWPYNDLLPVGVDPHP